MNYTISEPKGADRDKLIKQLSDTGCVMRIWYDEDPNDWDGTEGIKLVKEDENIYLMHPPFSYSDLLKWLYLGGWRMSFPAHIVTPMIDTFRENPETVMRVFNDTKIEIVIDSFHDNSDWKVFERDSKPC